jgi:hypothetical protein
LRTREKEGSDEEGREGLRMQRNEEGIPEEEEEFGELCRGRRYKRQNTGDEKGYLCSETEGRGPCAIIQFVEIPHI